MYTNTTELEALLDQALDFVDTHEAPSPHAVADVMRDAIPAADAHAVLAIALPAWVARTFSRRRLLHAPSTPVAPAAAAPTPSAKVAACRDDWARTKDTPLKTPDGWKRLGDCTSVDLLAVASGLYDMAAKNTAKARWYEALAAELAPGQRVDVLKSAPTVTEG